jgi:hypothetical protein
MDADAADERGWTWFTYFIGFTLDGFMDDSALRGLDWN